jgi:hypothetical protein
MKSLPKFTQFSDFTCLSHFTSLVRKHLLISELICRKNLLDSSNSNNMKHLICILWQENTSSNMVNTEFSSYLLGYNPVQSIESWQLFHAGFLLGLIFHHVDGGDIFLRNVGLLSMDYTVSYPEERTLHNHCCENPISYMVNTNNKK